MNRGYDWRLGKVRSIATDGKVIYDTALSRFRLADDGEGTPYDPLLGVRVGTLLNQEPDAPEGAILTEDGLNYLMTEDELFYIEQETEV